MRIYTDPHGQRWTVTDEQFAIERDRRRVVWEQAEEALKAAKIAEANARRDFVDWSFDQNNVEGTERVSLGGGYEAKVVKALTFSFIKDASGHIHRNAISLTLKELYNKGVDIDGLVKWSPSLSKSSYEALSDEHRAIIDRVIVTDYGLPKLEIVKSTGKPTL